MNLQLRFLTGPRKGQTCTLVEGTTYRFGRDAECEIQLEESKVSRNHAVLEWQKGEPNIEDLGSTNGVFVNGIRVRNQPLQMWDLIMIGRSELRVETAPDKASSTEGISPSDISQAEPDGVDASEYNRLFACMLQIQKILNRDEDTIVYESLGSVFRVLPASRLSLLEVDENGELQQSYALTLRGPTEEYVGRSFARKVLEADEAKLMEDTSHLDKVDWGETIQEQRVRSILGVPVRNDGKTVAVLLCDNQEQPNALSKRHLKVMEFVSLAMEGVFHRKIRRELESKQLRTEQHFLAAKRVQNQILNKDPDTISGNVRWKHHYQPALEVGGDFFDFHERPDGVSWLVADVSGKGISAALVVSMLKAFCKSLHARDLSPARFLRELSDAINGELPPSMFVTAVALRCTNDGLLSYASAGHPPGLFIRPRKKSVSWLKTSPGVVGSGTSHSLLKDLSDQKLELEPGDRVCFYTDGVVDAGFQRDALDEDAFRNILASTIHMPLEEALRQTVREVQAHEREEELADDLTLIMGEYSPPKSD